MSWVSRAEIRDTRGLPLSVWGLASPTCWYFRWPWPGLFLVHSHQYNLILLVKLSRQIEEGRLSNLPSTFPNLKLNEHLWGAAGGLRRAVVENRQNFDPITVVTSVKRPLIMVAVRVPLKTLQNR